MNTAAPQLNTERTGYVPELDAFRFVAIFSVMCLHWLPEHNWVNLLQDQISNGVHLFFVLSGFLITRILMRCREEIERGESTMMRSLGQFYARRFLRIFPVYYLVLALGVIFAFKGLRAGLPWHALYLSNFYYVRKGAFDGPASLFWTLSVEEQFYLIWPLALLLLPRRTIFPVVIGVAVVGTVSRVNAILADSWFRILLPSCMNFLAMGALVAVAESPFTGSPQHREKLLRIFKVLIVVLIVAAIVVASLIGWHAAVGSPKIRAIDQPMMSMVYAVVFAWASGGTSTIGKRLLRFSPVVYLGKISYGLYLYHQFVNDALLRSEHRLAQLLGSHSAHLLTNTFPARFLVTVLVAMISWHLFEKPLNDLKRFFPYGKKPHSTALEERGIPLIASGPDISASAR